MRPQRVSCGIEMGKIGQYRRRIRFNEAAACQLRNLNILRGNDHGREASMRPQRVSCGIASPTGSVIAPGSLQ